MFFGGAVEHSESEFVFFGRVVEHSEDLCTGAVFLHVQRGQMSFPGLPAQTAMPT